MIASGLSWLATPDLTRSFEMTAVDLGLTVFLKLRLAGRCKRALVCL